MSEFAIRVENLSKQYRIGGPQGRYKYKTLRESLIGAVQTPFRRAGMLVRGQALRLRSGQAYGAAEMDETIWALKDVSFEVKRGEVVGIIGRNGAGKTTLLKILSRITEPTEGWADVYGRVGSLLEVGTGFHPELTGRENIYLNGAILGMKRAEIERKFDEIVDFSGVEKFIDTPVKHYSSGMYVRLAFAVAAHLEPEILLIDEVLAVGDVAFQKKCLGKMGDMASEGRPVLFVSHNMDAIQRLCSRAILLKQGHLADQGQVGRVVKDYLADTVIDTERLTAETSESTSFVLQALEITSLEGGQLAPLRPALIRVRCFPKRDLALVACYVGIHTPDQELLLGLTTWGNVESPSVSKGSLVEMRFFLKSLPLLPGEYFISLYLQSAGDVNEDMGIRVPFEVLNVVDPRMPRFTNRRWRGVVAAQAKSEIEVIGESSPKKGKND